MSTINDTIEEITDNLSEGVVLCLKSGNKVLKISQDDDSESPRMWGNIGIMACDHSRCNLGDEKPDDNVGKRGPRNSVFIRTLWMYEHSSSTIYMGEWPPNKKDMYDQWDTSCIGYVYTTKSKLREIMGSRSKSMSETDIEERINAELGTYNKWRNGDVYWFETHTEKTCSLGEQHAVFEDGCGGFYSIKEAIETSGVLEGTGVDPKSFV